MKLHELLEKRSKAVAEMRGLADLCEKENRDYTDDESKRHKELKGEVADLDKKIERARELQEAERSAPAIIQGNGRDGAYEDRARQFSLVRAINARLGDSVDDGLEREVGQEVRSRSGREFQGIACPDEYFQVERRTLTVGGDAASLYPTMHRGDLFIDLLRSAIVVGRLGATILDGLMGDQDIPKQTASSQGQWVGEDGEITATDGDFGDVSLTPKTVGAITSYSRRTLINAVPSIEMIVRRDLAAVVANAIDLKAMTGDGSGNTPTGITNAADVHSLTLATPSWAEVLEFIARIEHSDADIGALGWALNPHAVKKLRGTLKVSGDAGAGYLMNEPGNLAGYAAARTSALLGTPGESPVEAATVIFGAWSQLLVGYWSGVDILANPYESAAYARGRVLIRAMRDVDVAVRHGESFAFANDLSVEAA